MLTVEQLEDRKNYIGASEAAGVLGLSRWQTPLSIWAVKTGEILAEDISGKLYVKLGHLLEDDMTELFEEQENKKLHRVNETRFHPQHNFIAANLDRRVVGENVPVELKTANVFKKKEWEGEEIPREYIIQCLHTLLVTGAPYMYLGVLIGSQDFQVKKVERDEEVIKTLLRREIEFWNDYVVPKVMPTVVTKNDTDILDRLFPEAIEGDPIDLADEASQLVEFLDGFKRDRNNLNALIDEHENKLKFLLGNHNIGKTPSGALIKWANVTTNRMNIERFKQDFDKVYKEYCEEKTSRRFSYKLKMEGN